MENVVDTVVCALPSLQGKIGLNAAHMVMELIRDNRKIVDRISHDHINTFVDLLQREKVVCVCLVVLCCVCVFSCAVLCVGGWLMGEGKGSVCVCLAVLCCVWVAG